MRLFAFQWTIDRTLSSSQSAPRRAGKSPDPVAVVTHSRSPPLWHASVIDAKKGEGCAVDGKTYQHEEIWKPEPCRVCACQNGVTLCEEIQCKLLPDCEKVTTPAGECCPVCDTFAGAGGRIGEVNLAGGAGSRGHLKKVIFKYINVAVRVQSLHTSI